ncbi:Unknown protein [Striga hermonthica]|uniref:Uncharacterized protein n=1 Tax=Striga hermonthica TaxID=68872 RepID=A0A9N7RCA2_STRHE|nr:Unknown protein [Striga hermonthica]
MWSNRFGRRGVGSTNTAVGMPHMRTHTPPRLSRQNQALFKLLPHSIRMEIVNAFEPYGDLAAATAEEEGCRTPEHGIPERSAPPPPPRKRPIRGGKKEPPENEYFRPPELEELFAALTRTEACA